MPDLKPADDAHHQVPQFQADAGVFDPPVMPGKTLYRCPENHSVSEDEAIRAPSGDLLCPIHNLALTRSGG